MSKSVLSRRSFFQRSSLVATAFAGLKTFCSQAADASPAEGALESDFYEIMDLLPGFRYVVISEQGDRMDDGLTVPGKHDGMGAFAGPQGKTILVRNHENETAWKEYSPFGSRRGALRRVDRAKLYDGGYGRVPGLGGTTTLLFDTQKQKLERHFLSLAGTYRNCAGGVTPWNSWISCEEAVDIAEYDIEKDHGYNFEVPASPEIGLVDPHPLKEMGRFRHEAIAVDPATGIIYQTEDRYDGLFYRFIPNRRGQLAAGGRLQALRCRELGRADTRNWEQRRFVPGEKIAVDWVDLANAQAPDDDLRYQGYFENKAARFARAEGIWHGHDSIFFAATNGGRARAGQIWRYYPSPHEGMAEEDKKPGQLELFIEPNDGNLVQNADNLTVAPWGDLIICEDRQPSKTGQAQFVVAVTPNGRIYRLARTTVSELAGACFSPDGATLFVNIQTPGMTVAITGPWESLKQPGSGLRGG